MVINTSRLKTTGRWVFGNRHAVPAQSSTGLGAFTFITGSPVGRVQKEQAVAAPCALDLGSGDRREIISARDLPRSRFWVNSAVAERLAVTAARTAPGTGFGSSAGGISQVFRRSRSWPFRSILHRRPPVRLLATTAAASLVHSRNCCIPYRHRALAVTARGTARRWRWVEETHHPRAARRARQARHQTATPGIGKHHLQLN